MKWTSIKTWEYRVQARGCWHLWFAWYPVAVETKPDGAKVRVWWVRVLRKMTPPGWPGDPWERKYMEIHDLY